MRTDCAGLNTGSVNLRKARFFLDQLTQTEQADPFDHEAAAAFLEAAIIFGKTTQDRMADLYGGRDKGDRVAWLKSTSLWNDPLCKFFADLRDLIVHEDGSVETLSRTSAVITLSGVTASYSTSQASLRVNPSNPSFLQRLRIALEIKVDAIRAERQHRRQARQHERRRAALLEEARSRAARLPSVQQITQVQFKEPESIIGGRAAQAVVSEYLDHLERVLEAQQ